MPTCGDYITDSGEECDEGSAGTADCSDTCQAISLDSGGCCSTGGGQGSVGLSLLVGILLLRRRRA
jgi:MYXO-CTERM domain-containing protein